MSQPTISDRISAANGGANQVGVKAYNERLVLSLVRQHGELAKADVSRLSGLSAQAVATLIRGLEDDHLLVRGEPRRGRVGQPSIPLSLNPRGAYALGVKIGRRSADVTLIDFLGNIQSQQSVQYRWPDPEKLLRFSVDAVRGMVSALPGAARARVTGVGVAMPFRIWEWPAELGAPDKKLEAWREHDFVERLASETGIKAFLYNDGTSACAAELAFGQGIGYSDFVYFFVATFIGGGIVLNRALYPGRTGNAATLGTMVFTHDDGSTTQLLHHASILSLEQRVCSSLKSVAPINWQGEFAWKKYKQSVDSWLESVSHYLAVAIGSACSIVDFEAAILDGVFPDEIKARLVERVRSNIQQLNIEGVASPAVVAGSIGKHARVVGGASRPLIDRYFLDQSVLFKPF